MILSWLSIHMPIVRKFPIKRGQNTRSTFLHSLYFEVIISRFNQRKKVGRDNNMPDTKLILICGMSGAGKSTTAQSLAYQYQKNGIRHRWLHEEIRNHPIRAGEFSLGSLYDAQDMERNIQDMYRRWKRFIARIMRSKSVYITEGILFENILRYFFIANYPSEKIAQYYDQLMQIMAPACPVVVHLIRSDVRSTLEKMYSLRGSWWKDLILNPDGYRYFEDHGLSGAEGVYTMWQDYQNLADAMFQRCPSAKIQVDTTQGEWDGYIQSLAQFLGLNYSAPTLIPISAAEKYCGKYSVEVEGQLHALDIQYDGKNIFCSAFWPYMKLLPLGGSRFVFSSFPVWLTFVNDKSSARKAVHVRGNYDWEIMGKTLIAAPTLTGETQ
jgi:hypothetical protein